MTQLYSADSSQGRIEVVKETRAGEKVTALKLDGETLMSDTAYEKQYSNNLLTMRGKVLMAGLGLGMAQEKLVEQPNVTSVTTVEINEKVVDAHEQLKGIHQKHSVVTADFRNYESDEKYDFIQADVIDAFYDDRSVQLMKKVAKQAYKLLKPGGVFTYWHSNTTRRHVEFIELLKQMFDVTWETIGGRGTGWKHIICTKPL